VSGNDLPGVYGDKPDALVADQRPGAAQAAFGIAIWVEQCDIDSLLRIVVQVEFNDREAVRGGAQHLFSSPHHEFEIIDERDSYPTTSLRAQPAHGPVLPKGRITQSQDFRSGPTRHRLTLASLDENAT
jgi:hypothetical protein